MPKKKLSTDDNIWPYKAYNNRRFLNSPSARSIRVLCEYTEPQVRFRKYGVKDTVVFFGSARTLPQDLAQKNLKNVKKKLKKGQKVSKTLAGEIKQAEDDLTMSRYYEDAVILAKHLTRWSQKISKSGQRFLVCSGGGPGIMEAANRGAKEVKGKSIGLNINLPFEQEPNTYQTKEYAFDFHYFFIRKFWFFYLAKALVVFPGGFGTMDELFELLTLIQTGKTKKYMPIIIYGKKFWEEIIDFDAMVKWGVISKSDLKLFSFFDDPGEAFQYLKKELTNRYLKK